MKGEWNWGKWGVDLLGKVALGNTHETMHIDGSVLITLPGGVGHLAPGGLLALPSNIGTYSRDDHTESILLASADSSIKQVCSHFRLGNFAPHQSISCIRV